MFSLLRWKHFCRVLSQGPGFVTLALNDSDELYLDRWNGFLDLRFGNLGLTFSCGVVM